MSIFQKWPDIESLGNVVKSARRYAALTGATSLVVTYRAKVKLHGTNAAVRIDRDGTVTAQSRTRDITPDDDNYGFAAWVESKADSFRWLDRRSSHDPDADATIIFGEWVGPGVNSGCAVHQIAGKVFATFHAQGADVFVEDMLTVCHHIDFIGPSYTVNLLDDASVAAFAAQVNEAVAVVEAEDPWVRANFGISGLGEGLVFYALGDVPDSVKMFKAKGEKHRVNKTKTAAGVDEETLTSRAAFCDKYVTDARVAQALAEVCGGVFALDKMGALIGWVCKDVEKESGGDQPESWKSLSSAVAKAARLKFIE